MPELDKLLRLSDLFGVTLDELVLQESQLQSRQKTVYESETVYDIDGDKHFDIRMGSARSLLITSGSDEKIHIKLQSDTLENISSLYKIKLDEKKNRLDIDCIP